MNTGGGYILVVEDERALVGAIKLKLVLSGFKVSVADSVKQAKETINKLGRPVAVWLDHYLMGEETGADLLRYLKSSKELKDVSVFVVSNTATPEKVQVYLSLGAKKYYTKSNYRLDQIIADIKESLPVA